MLWSLFCFWGYSMASRDSGIKKCFLFRFGDRHYEKTVAISVINSVMQMNGFPPRAARLDEFFGSSAFAGIVDKAMGEGILPPFHDAGPTRRVAWEQLGARWFVEWKNEYETAQAAEGFCATLQTLLEDLHTVELALLPSDVYLKIAVHDGKLEIDDNSDNEKIQLEIRLPRTALTTDGNPEMAAVVQGVSASALNLVSAIPQDRFLDLFKKRAISGLFDKFFPYAAYDRLFREFYLEGDYKEHYSHSRGVQVDSPAFVGKTDPALAGPVGLHPSYRKSESEGAIRRRYEAFSLKLKYTLPRLKQDTDFLATVAELRKQGWKDWHILQAVAHVRMNYILNKAPSPPSIAELRETGKSLFNREEQPTDPVVPRELFTVAELKRNLTFAQAATLKGLGFELPQHAPNFSGLNRFLQR